MTINNIKDLLGAEVLCGSEHLENDVHSACGSDMMSDVLAFVKDQAVLLTGLVNLQVIRTAEMMDMLCIVFSVQSVPLPKWWRQRETAALHFLQQARECMMPAVLSIPTD